MTVRSGDAETRSVIPDPDDPYSSAFQYMTLACPIKNTLIHSYEDDFSYDLDIVITAVAYRNKEKFDNDEYVTLEDSTELTRTVHCKRGEKWCNEITVYEVNSVDFQFYGFRSAK